MNRTKLYQAGGAYYCVLSAFLYDDVKTTSLEMRHRFAHCENVFQSDSGGCSELYQNELLTNKQTNHDTKTN